MHPLRQAAEQASSQRYIVKYKQQQMDSTGPGMFNANAMERRRFNLERRQARLAQRGARVKELLAAQSALAAELSAADLAELQQDSDVELIEEDYKRFPMAQQIPYGFVMVQADQVSDEFASNQKVCIIDSGLDLPHEDFLSGNITGTNNSGTGNWYDNGGPHGTHVAGTIAALNNATGMVGVMPNGNIKLHIVKVFNEEGWGYSSTLASAVNTCVSNGSTVINMSLGGGRANSTEENAFINFTNNGGLVLAAAGNSGNTTRSYPAGYTSVMMIGANDANDQIATFSQYPSCTSGTGRQQTTNEGLCVEVTAGGVDTLSTYPAGGAAFAALTANNTGYAASAMENTGDAAGNTYFMGLATSTNSAAAGKICVIDRGVIIPEGLVVGQDPEEDAKWFRRSEGGIVLITQDMLDARARKLS